MGRTSGNHRRALAGQALIQARELVAAEGLESLTARRLAKELGCAVGTLYNLYPNLDTLIIAVNQATLAELETRLRHAMGEGHTPPERQLTRMVAAYLAFTREERHRWEALFRHRPPAGTEPPEAYRRQVERLLGLVEEALAPLLPAAAMERHALARVLWFGLHGICTMADSGRLPLVTDQGVEPLATTLLDTLLAGVRARFPLPHPTASREG